MYLIRAELDRFSPEVRAAMADCQQMHRLVTRLIGAAREEANILYRIHDRQGSLKLYIYSDKPADADMSVVQKDMSAWLDTLSKGEELSFDLLASPCRKQPAEGRKNSQRRILRSPEERRAWLNRKAEQNGFEIRAVAEMEQLQQTGVHREEVGGKMYLDAFHYQGILRVIDLYQFRAALEKGIGPGKAYGYGMLLVKKL